MKRVFASCLLGLGVAVLASACANGNTTGTDVSASDSTSTDGGGGGDGGCPIACGADQVCSAGACVPSTTDAGGDGYPASKDCDDHDPAVHPGATEVCNGKDDNCDGRVDEGFDADGDGYVTCAVNGRAADCDDKDPAIHPGAVEVCNFKDDDCNGVIDDGFDKDNDGYYACAHGALAADCDDNDPAVHPGAVEICDGKDNDCNGKIDDKPALLNGAVSTPPDPHWKTAGDASFLSGWAQLTPDAATKAGALWWNAPYTFDTFDVSASIAINKANGADGMAFAWIPGNAVNVVGAGAGGYGVWTPDGGWAVAIDTYQNTDQGEPLAPFLTVVRLTGPETQIARQSISTAILDNQPHTFRVKLDAGVLNVWLDGVAYFTNFALPAYTPFSGHWGFGGATGGLSESHWVKDVVMSFPNGQGCVP